MTVFVAEIGDPDRVRCVPRETGNRRLVVDYADGKAHAPETPDDAETLIVLPTTSAPAPRDLSSVTPGMVLRRGAPGAP